MIRKGKGFDANGHSKRNEKRERMREALKMTQSVFAVGTAVILAGVVAPTVLHGMAGHGHGPSNASLHVFHAAGVTFFYTLENLGFAFLGVLFGAIVAWAIEYRDILPRIRLVRLVSRWRGLASW